MYPGYVSIYAIHGSYGSDSTVIESDLHDFLNGKSQQSLRRKHETRWTLIDSRKFFSRTPASIHEVSQQIKCQWIGFHGRNLNRKP